MRGDSLSQLPKRTRSLSQVLILAATVVVLLYYVTTMRIYYASISGAPYSWLPFGYWFVVLGALVLASLVFLHTSDTKWDYLAISILQAALFLGPELMETSVRYNDSFSFLYLTNYATNPAVYHQITYSQINYILNWPGFFQTVGSLFVVTGIGYYDGAKFIFVSSQVILLILSFALGKAVLGTRRAGLLMGLAMNAINWDVWTTISPVLFGEIFLMTFLLVFLKAGKSRKEVGLLVVIFLSATLTHGLTSLVIMTILTVTFLLHLAKSKMSHGALLGMLSNSVDLKVPVSSALILITCVTAFFLWFMLAPTAINSGTILAIINFIFNAGATPIVSQLGYLTPARYLSILTAAVYAIVLAAWLVVLLVIALRTKNKIDLLPLVLLSLVTFMIYFFAPTSQNFYDRVFQDGFPFIGLLAVSLMLKFEGRTGKLSMAFVMVLLVLSFLAAYSHEPVLIYPPSEIAGDYFTTIYVPSNTVVAYPSSGPTPQGLANTPQGPTIIQFVAGDRSQLLLGVRQSDFVIESAVVTNSLLYYFGEKDFGLGPFTNHDIVYDSGYFSLISSHFF